MCIYIYIYMYVQYISRDRAGSGSPGGAHSAMSLVILRFTAALFN